MDAKRRPLMAGNWKMHKNVAEARALARGLRERLGSQPGAEVVVCPPFTALLAVHEELKGSPIGLGGQTMSWHEKGAFTGEVAPPMLVDVGCTYVILGHSERRQLYGETDHAVRQKVEAALTHKLTPIVCVGETLEEREGMLTDNVVIVQAMRALHRLEPQQVEHLVFAYEPVWAIGTGKTCDADEADRVCGLIRDTVARQAGPDVAARVRVLYGGSVKPETIADQMARPNVDGALVGGASLEVDSFARIVEFEKAVR